MISFQLLFHLFSDRLPVHRMQNFAVYMSVLLAWIIQSMAATKDDLRIFYRSYAEFIWVETGVCSWKRFCATPEASGAA